MNFRYLVEKYITTITLQEESKGFYDYENGGKWTAEYIEKEIKAAVFNLTTKDISGMSIQYSEGGSYTKDDIKIYLYEALGLGSNIKYKGRQYTVSTELDYSDHANGLWIYIARRTGKLDEKTKK